MSGVINNKFASKQIENESKLEEVAGLIIVNYGVMNFMINQLL